MYIGVDFIVRGLASVDYLWVPGKEEHLKEGRPFTMEPNSSYFCHFQTVAVQQLLFFDPHSHARSAVTLFLFEGGQQIVDWSN